jgi:hypothetical protein
MRVRSCAIRALLISEPAVVFMTPRAGEESPAALAEKQ